MAPPSSPSSSGGPQWVLVMARKSRTAVLKRQREARKAEKAAAKREKRVERESAESVGERVATSDDLEGYGFSVDVAEAEEEPEPPPRGPSPHRVHEPLPPDPSWPRYSTGAFPAYRYIPGRSPHPRRDARASG